MVAEADSVAQPGQPAKRRLRNYLLDRRFQLKYTGMVVLVTMLVASVLGYFVYQYSQENLRMSQESTEIYTASVIANVSDAQVQEQMIAKADALDSRAEERHVRVSIGIIVGILVLSLALGVTGIVVTHKVVGPAYKLKRLLGEVAQGRFRIESRLRKGDELQDVFEAFAQMADTLCEQQVEEVRELDEAIAQARTAGVADDTLEPLQQLRQRMHARTE